jgi:citrate synthase
MKIEEKILKINNKNNIKTNKSDSEANSKINSKINSEINNETSSKINSETNNKINNTNNHRIRTSITNIQPNKIITRGYPQEELINNISFSEMVYLLLKGELPSSDDAKMLNHILISFCDHGVTPPSTQTSRLIASSGSPLNVSLAGGLLSFGKNHAGAIEDSMELFQELIKSYFNNNGSNDINIIANNIINEYKLKNKKIPGFGHRYHNKDPRGAKLMELAKKENFIGPHSELALAIGEILFKEKGININVDGASGALLSDMGFSSNEGFGIFMIGRIPGIIAHVNEEVNDEEEFRKFCDISDISYCGDLNKSLDD